MMDHTHHVIAVYHGMIPDYGYEVFHTYAEAMARWEEVGADWSRIEGPDGEPFDPDEHRYATDGHDGEARWDQGEIACPHDLLAVEVRRLLVAAGCPPSVRVDVTEWAGCDEPWGDPIYATATDHAEREYHDAVADLDSAPLGEQAAFVTDQLLNG